MLTGKVNAKRDFVDYEQYFLDDTEVMKRYCKGGVKAFCEPWSPPGVVSPIRFVYTLKTALETEDKSFMLGTFQLVDELILGEVSSKVYAHDAHRSLPMLHDTVVHAVEPIPSIWFQNAFSQLPLGNYVLVGVYMYI